MADEQPSAPSDATTEAIAEAMSEAASEATPTDVAAETTSEAAPAEAPQAAEASAPADRVAELEARVAALRAEVEREREQATSYMRHWHEAQADLANFKRRAQQEQEQRERLAVAQAHAPTIHALDSLERAFLALPPTLRGFSWIEGIALVELQLRRALDLQGIRAIAVEPGQPFDPQRHEPIGEVESAEIPEGAIAVVAQRGYEANGLLIRPTLVQLARKPAPGDQSSPASGSGGQSATEATPGT